MKDDDLKKLFVSNIEYYIARTGKNQREVAKDLGYEPTTFNTWCVGKILPTLPKLQHMAAYFGCDVSDLIAPPGQRKDTRMVEVTDEELRVLNAYRRQENSVKDGICRMLEVKRELDGGSSVASAM